MREQKWQQFHPRTTRSVLFQNAPQQQLRRRCGGVGYGNEEMQANKDSAWANYSQMARYSDRRVGEKDEKYDLFPPTRLCKTEEQSLGNRCPAAPSLSVPCFLCCLAVGYKDCMDGNKEGWMNRHWASRPSEHPLLCCCWVPAVAAALWHCRTIYYVNDDAGDATVTWRKPRSHRTVFVCRALVGYHHGRRPAWVVAAAFVDGMNNNRINHSCDFEQQLKRRFFCIDCTRAEPFTGEWVLLIHHGEYKVETTMHFR